MRVPLLITGGTGYLGAELVRQAIAAGHPVTATFQTQQPHIPNAAWHQLDVRDAAAVQQLFAAIQPAAVIHTAYVQDGSALWDTTALGAGYVAAAAHSHGAQLVHLSSDVIFDGEQGAPYAEDSPPAPVSAYGHAKAEAERLVIAAHPAALIVRTSLIYGGTVLSKHEQLALDAADGEKDVAFFEDEVRNPAQVGELAASILAALVQNVRGVLHVAAPEPVSRYTFAQLVAAAHGRDPRRIKSARSSEQPVRRPRDCRLATERAQALGLHLRSPHHVLRPPVAP